QGRGRLGGADGAAPALLYRSHGYDPDRRPGAHPSVVANDLFPGVQIAARGENAYFPIRRAVRTDPYRARGGDVRSRPDVGRGGRRARTAGAPHFSKPEHAIRRDGRDVGEDQDLRRTHLSTL